MCQSFIVNKDGLDLLRLDRATGCIGWEIGFWWEFFGITDIDSKNPTSTVNLYLKKIVIINTL